MMNRGWNAAVLLSLAMLAPATACTTSGSDPAPAAASPTAPSVPADPKAALVASTAELRKGNFRFTMRDPEANGHGSVNAGARSARMNVVIADTGAGVTLDLQFLQVGEESWMKIDLDTGDLKVPDLPKFPKQWMHLDPSKVKDLGDVAIDFADADPADTALVLAALVTAEQTTEGRYQGTVDLTKATDSQMVDEETVRALGERARAVPFAATIDRQGRLTTLKLNLPAAGDNAAHTVQATFADYGAAPVDQPPAPTEVVEAPPAAYEWLNSES